MNVIVFDKFTEEPIKYEHIDRIETSVNEFKLIRYDGTWRAFSSVNHNFELEDML